MILSEPHTGFVDSWGQNVGQLNARHLLEDADGDDDAEPSPANKETGAIDVLQQSSFIHCLCRKDFWVASNWTRS